MRPLRLENCPHVRGPFRSTPQSEARRRADAVQPAGQVGHGEPLGDKRVNSGGPDRKLRQRNPILTGDDLGDRKAVSWRGRVSITHNMSRWYMGSDRLDRWSR